MKLRDSAHENDYILDLLKNSGLNELRLIRQNLGKIVHERLSQNPTQNKLLLNSGLAPGLANDALANNNGSSKYLLGGLVEYAQNIDIEKLTPQNAGQVAKELANKDFDFSRSAGMEDCGIVAGCNGLTSGQLAGKVLVYAGTQNNIQHKLLDLEVNEMPGSTSYRQALQEASSIMVLEEILELLGQDLSLDESTSLTADTSKKEVLAPEIQLIEGKNQHTWEQMLPLLKTSLKGEKLSIGESFTAGILGKIFTSVEGATSIFDWNLNWYDPRLKQYVGVPAKNVTEELIAEPETIAIACSGLLKKAPATTGIALGTTGWANYWVKGEADYFSIGVASKYGQLQKAGVLTAKIHVQSSSGHDKTFGRRQLTRHLGATTVLYLLANEMAQRGGTDQEKFREIAKELSELIEKYGTIELKTFTGEDN